MINPINYLFYKIYNGLDIIGGGQEAIATTMIININFITIVAIIFNEISLFFLAISVIGGSCLVTYFTNNEEKILKKYESESESSRKIGNTIVTIYVILTFLIPYLLIRNSN